MTMPAAPSFMPRVNHSRPISLPVVSGEALVRTASNMSKREVGSR